MRLLHITEAKNLQSILRTGLKPRAPRLSHHCEALRHDRLPSKVIYAWDARDIKKMTKVAKDVAYWHVWGWRINNLLREDDDKTFENRRLQIQGDPIEDRVFVALVFDMEEGVHRYWSTGSRIAHSAHPETLTANNHWCWTDMDLRYAHKVMPMTWVTKVVPPEKIRPWAMLWTVSKRRRWVWDVDVHIKRFK